MSHTHILDYLYHVITERQKMADPKKSYTAQLFDKGRKRIVQKVGEESIEVCIAALKEPRDRVIKESSDLLFHLLVLWRECQITPEEIWQELYVRHHGAKQQSSAKQEGVA